MLYVCSKHNNFFYEIMYMSDVYLRMNEMKTMKLYFGTFLILTSFALIFKILGLFQIGLNSKNVENL